MLLLQEPCSLCLTEEVKMTCGQTTENYMRILQLGFCLTPNPCLKDI